MSLYCLGSICPRKNECLRVEAYKDLIQECPEIEKMTLSELADLCIWFVPIPECRINGYEDGVFLEKGGEK